MNFHLRTYIFIGYRHSFWGVRASRAWKLTTISSLTVYIFCFECKSDQIQHRSLNIPKNCLIIITSIDFVILFKDFNHSTWEAQMDYKIHTHDCIISVQIELRRNDNIRKDDYGSEILTLQCLHPGASCIS